MFICSGHKRRWHKLSLVYFGLWKILAWYIHIHTHTLTDIHVHNGYQRFLISLSIYFECLVLALASCPYCNKKKGRLLCNKLCRDWREIPIRVALEGCPKFSNHGAATQNSVFGLDGGEELASYNDKFINLLYADHWMVTKCKVCPMNDADATDIKKFTE